jgi:hypothetical protein
MRLSYIFSCFLDSARAKFASGHSPAYPASALDAPNPALIQRYVALEINQSLVVPTSFQRLGTDGGEAYLKCAPLFSSGRDDQAAADSQAPTAPRSISNGYAIGTKPQVAHSFNMTVLKPRSRMISVRLSDEEYLALRRLCSVTGARSVSDLTRDAMRVLLNGANREEVLGNHMDEFRAHMKSLDRKIEQLAAEITSFKGENGR